MFKAPMPDIKRKHDGKYLFIPGGWNADLPRIKLESCVVDAWALYLRQDGRGTMESIAMANAIGQRVYEAGIRPGLLSHTMYWATKYAKMHPQHLERAGQIDGIYKLNGYDPTEVQYSYIPFHKTGRGGSPMMMNMISEMGHI